jgi:hypothetical protein
MCQQTADPEEAQRKIDQQVEQLSVGYYLIEKWYEYKYMNR